MAIHKELIIVLLGFCLSTSWAQNGDLTLSDNQIDPSKSHTFFLPISEIVSDLENAPDLTTERETAGIEIQIFLPNGNPFTVELHEAPVSQLTHYNKYSENRTYKITGGSLPFVNGRLAISPRGVRGLIYTDSKTIFIESLEGGNEHISYVYSKSKFISCDADMSQHRPSESSQERSSTSETMIL